MPCDICKQDFALIYFEDWRRPSFLDLTLPLRPRAEVIAQVVTAVQESRTGPVPPVGVAMGRRIWHQAHHAYACGPAAAGVYSGTTFSVQNLPVRRDDSLDPDEVRALFEEDASRYAWDDSTLTNDYLEKM